MTGILGGNRAKSGARLWDRGARSCACAALLCAAAAADGAHARPNPAPVLYGGHEFLSVGAPGNRAMLPVERYYNQNPTPVTEHVGAVNQPFRISKLEVSATQWLPFIQTAYPIWQEWGGNVDDSHWTSTHINNPTFGAPAYRINQGEENLAITTTWRVAALYCNWLQAGMPTGPSVNLDVIRTGAYDISTFRRAGPGGLTGPFLDQAERSPGAQFWIPNLSEWTKAAYFDPERYAPGNPGPTWGAGPPGPPGTNPPPPGPGEPPITGDTSGYWLYPNMSQEWPGFGGIPGEALYGGSGTPVGSFPDSASPWGVLDMLGGVEEWTETVALSQTVGNGRRYVRSGSESFAPNDMFALISGVNFSTWGVRIASVIPSAPTAVVVGAALLTLVGGTRQRPHYG